MSFEVKVGLAKGGSKGLFRVVNNRKVVMIRYWL